MPDDFRITVARSLIWEDGIAAVFRECPAVETVGNALDGWIARRRVDENERGDAILAETAGIIRIDDGAAAEHGAERIGREGVWQLRPMEQVFADGMAPMHVAPIDTVRIVLEEHMIFAVVEDKAVWIVVPTAIRREMNQRTERFAVWIVVFWWIVGENE